MDIMRFGTVNQYRASVALLAIIAVGLIVLFVRRGQQVQEGIVIQGAPQSSSEARRLSSNSVSESQSAVRIPVATSSDEPPAEVVVHVVGAVRRPGVYRFPPSARGEDALKAAGGATEKANTDAINLAAKLEDGQQLYVPSKEEPISIENREGRKTAALENAGGGNRKPSSDSGKLTTPGQGSVNINTASLEELQRLPGVGPSTAQKIIAYRKETGGFTAPEQLMDVSGIGEKKFAKMKPFVRVR
jgi:competence protein ComEA